MTARARSAPRSPPSVVGCRCGFVSAVAVRWRALAAFLLRLCRSVLWVQRGCPSAAGSVRPVGGCSLASASVLRAAGLACGLASSGPPARKLGGGAPQPAGWGSAGATVAGLFLSACSSPRLRSRPGPAVVARPCWPLRRGALSGLVALFAAWFAPPCSGPGSRAPPSTGPPPSCAGRFPAWSRCLRPGLRPAPSPPALPGSAGWLIPGGALGAGRRCGGPPAPAWSVVLPGSPPVVPRRPAPFGLVPLFPPLSPVGFSPAPPRPAAPAGGSGVRKAGRGVGAFSLVVLACLVGCAGGDEYRGGLACSPPRPGKDPPDYPIPRLWCIPWLPASLLKTRA